MVKQIVPIKDSLYQDSSLNLPIGEDNLRVVLELRYIEKTDRWYMSLFDVQMEHTYLLNVPLLSSVYGSVNNLWEPFTHKRIGMLACYPASDTVSTENPSKENISDFIIVWSDENVE